MKKGDKELVKASLIAGLKLWGLSNGNLRVGRDRRVVEKFAKRFKIDLNKFEAKGSLDSGLIWDWYEDGEYRSTIIREKISERIDMEVDCISAEDAIEDPGQIDDFEYVFKPDGSGYTGYRTDEDLFEKSLRADDGKLYTYFATECQIFVYEMDLNSKEEAREYIKKKYM